MKGQEHDRAALGAYVLGALDPDERLFLDEHLTGCEGCRAELAEIESLADTLGAVPPEAFLDRPPDGGDLLLQRTLHQVRAGTARRRARGRLVAAAAVAVVVAIGVGTGVLVGRGTAPSSPAGAATATAARPGTLAAERTDPTTGATLTGWIVPMAGWVSVHVTASGIPAGTPCDLYVVRKDGTKVPAGSWLVSAEGAKDGTPLDAPARVPADQVAAVEIDSGGRALVSAGP